MAKHNVTGSLGEDVAKEFLIGKGLKFVSANYRKPYGEIDLIFKDKADKHVFVEVKSVSWETAGKSSAVVPYETQSLELGAAKRVSKKNNKLLNFSVFRKFQSNEMASQKTQRQVSVRGETYRPEENIHPAKVARLLRVIQAYLVSHGIVGDWQFDVVAVFLDQKSKVAKVRHLKNVILGS